jgi:hypothetical protein
MRKSERSGGECWKQTPKDLIAPKETAARLVIVARAVSGGLFNI